LQLHSTTVNAELRDDITAGLCSTRDSEQISKLLSRLTDSNLVKRQDLFRWYIYLLRNRYAREQTWQWMVDNWSWIEETFKGDKSYDDFARYSANVFATRKWLETYIKFFEPMRNQTALKRAIVIGEIEIASRVEWLERDGEQVRATLAQETA
jgi:aminopeptidase N